MAGAAISYVVLSHGHGDHAGGLLDLEALGELPVLMNEAEWSAASKSTRLWAFKAAFPQVEGVRPRTDPMAHP